MGRTSRRATIAPDSGEGRQIGLDDREIPGGLEHIGNAETHQDKVEVPASRQTPSINMHRVEDDNPDAHYAKPKAGRDTPRRKPEPIVPELHSVPVYVVEQPGKVAKHRQAFADNMTVHILSDAVDIQQICGRDASRVEVRILNEDPNNDIRFSHDRGILLEGRGSLLWHGTNSYTTIPTQDELYAVAVTADCLMSIILVTEVNS